MAGNARVNCKSDGELMLLVEGINDCHAVFQLIWLIYKTDPVFGIHECGSDDQVLDSLAARLVASVPKQKILGLILDADIEGSNPGQVIRSRLEQLASRAGAYYPIPAVFPEDGLILHPLPTRQDADRLPKLGVWLMPNNRTFGMFEDLLLESLPKTVADYTTKVVMQSTADGVASFRDRHLSKAVIHTYLAWQDPPEMHLLGIAIQKGRFENIKTECKAFVQWVERLFGPLVPPS